MKKIVLFITILLPHLVLAAKDEWPIFSNDPKAENNLFMLKNIMNNYPKKSKIEDYYYVINPLSCELPLDPNDFKETQNIEYKIADPSESDANETTANYALFINNSIIDDSYMIVTRTNANKKKPTVEWDDIGNIAFDYLMSDIKEKKKKRNKKKKTKITNDGKEKNLPVQRIKKTKSAAAPDISMFSDIPVNNTKVTRTKSNSPYISMPISRQKSENTSIEFSEITPIDQKKSMEDAFTNKINVDNTQKKKKKKDQCSIM